MVTGTVQDATGHNATSGYVQFELSPFSSAILYRVAGNLIVDPIVAKCGINGSGQVKSFDLTTTCQVWGNDLISPSGTCYAVSFAPGNAVTKVIRSMTISGGSVDLSNPTFCPSVTIAPQQSTFNVGALTSSIIPATDNFFAIGSDLNRFANGYFRNLTVSGQISGGASLAGITGTLGQTVDLSRANDPLGTTTSTGLLARWNGTTLVGCTTANTTERCLPIVATVVSNGSTLCAPGTTGNACWLRDGRAPCTFDAAGASGSALATHFVVTSTATNGRCMDAGAGYPNGSEILGTINASVAPNASGQVDFWSAFSQVPTGYSQWQNAAVGVASRTKSNIVGGFMVATDNAGNASTDLTLGALPLIDGTDVAPAMYTSSAPNGEYLKKDTVASSGWMIGHNGSVYMRLSGGFQLAGGIQIAWNADNTFASFVAGICRSGALGVITIDAAGCGTGGGTLVAHNHKFDAFCNSSASPAVCSNYTAGYVVIAAGATTVQVNTTAVSATSMIQLTRNNSLGGLVSPAVTCNTQSSLVLGTPYVSAVSQANSFTVAVDVAPTTNPLCVNYTMLNN